MKSTIYVRHLNGVNKAQWLMYLPWQLMTKAQIVRKQCNYLYACNHSYILSYDINNKKPQVMWIVKTK